MAKFRLLKKPAPNVTHWPALRLDGKDAEQEKQLPCDKLPSNAKEGAVVARTDDGYFEASTFSETTPDAAPEEYCGPEVDGDGHLVYNPARGNPPANSVFLPPYNFVRIDEAVRRRPFDDVARHELLADYCGRLTCKLTTTTPIFIPDTERTTMVQVTGGEHKRLPFFSVGNPSRLGIPATSLKGMIRSVVEAVTNSCLSILDDKRHGWRRVTNLPERKPYRFLRGPSGVTQEEYPDCVRLSQNATRPGGAPFAHGDGVEVQTVQLRQHGFAEVVVVRDPATGAVLWDARRTLRSVVVTLANQKWARDSGSPANDYRVSDTLNVGQRISGSTLTVTATCELLSGKGGIKRYVLEVNGHPPLSVSAWRKGIVKRADPVTNKANERVFITPCTPATPVDPTAWQRYLDAHADAKDPVRRDPLASNGGYGYLAETRCGKQHGVTPLKGLSLGPVHMFREAYDNTVSDAVPQALRPDACGPADGLCPACALFGGIFGAGALAGRVAFNPAWHVSGPAPLQPVALRILSTPKTSFFPFYLQPVDSGRGARKSVDYNGTPWQPGRRPDDSQFGAQSVSVRGRKFYWHHPDHSTDAKATYGLEEPHIEAHSGEETNQNVTAQLLPAGNEFTFEVDFENLSLDELGLLIWVLELEDGLQHKLGMGKPIGLGSVKIEVTGLVTQTLAYEDPFDPEETSDDAGDLRRQATAAFLGSELKSPCALADLRQILRFGLLDDAHRPAYRPACIEANEGFNYYMDNRHQPLVTIQEAAHGERARQRHAG